MAYRYGANRGNIRSIAGCSAPDPWADTIDSCEQVPVRHRAKSIEESPLRAPSVATYQVHNACELASLCPNAERMMQRLRAAKVKVTDQIVGLASDPTNPGDQQPARGCLDGCKTNPDGDAASTHGLNKHLRWPTEWTESTPNFLKENRNRDP